MRIVNTVVYCQEYAAAILGFISVICALFISARCFNHLCNFMTKRHLSTFVGSCLVITSLLGSETAESEPPPDTAHYRDFASADELGNAELGQWRSQGGGGGGG